MPCHTRMKRIVQGLLWLFLLEFGFLMAMSLEPGYLDFDNLPDTNFSCVGKVIGGYYADLETNCQMFHVCTIGQLDEPMDIRFLCLNGTVFDQETRVCERIDEVDCSKSEQFYSLNLELYGNTQPPLLEEELPVQIKKTSTTTSTTTTTTTQRPSRPKTTYYTTSAAPTSTRAPTKVITSHHFPVVNSPDIRFNPEEINISLNPGAPPAITRQQVPISYQHHSYSNNEKNTRVTVTTHTTIYKNDKPHRIPLLPTHQSPSHSLVEHEAFNQHKLVHTTPTPKSVVSYGLTHSHGVQQQQQHAHPTEINYGFTYQQTEGSIDYNTEHPYHYQINIANLRPPTAQGQPYHSYRTTTKRPKLHFPVPTTFRNHPAYTSVRTSQSEERHLQKTEKPPRLQLPLPLLPTLPPLTFSSPAPFTLGRRIEAKRYTNDHQPRIIISASASVSDNNGRRLNYSLGTIGATSLISPSPSAYDDYKDDDVEPDPFYHDVPKIKSLRHKRSTVNEDEIIKNEQEAADLLKFLFNWYQKRQQKTKITFPVTSDDISTINHELAPIQGVTPSDNENIHPHIPQENNTTTSTEVHLLTETLTTTSEHTPLQMASLAVQPTESVLKHDIAQTQSNITGSSFSSASVSNYLPGEETNTTREVSLSTSSPSRRRSSRRRSYFSTSTQIPRQVKSRRRNQVESFEEESNGSLKVVNDNDNYRRRASRRRAHSSREKPQTTSDHYTTQQTTSLSGNANRNNFTESIENVSTKIVQVTTEQPQINPTTNSTTTISTTTETVAIVYPLKHEDNLESDLARIYKLLGEDENDDFAIWQVKEKEVKKINDVDSNQNVTNSSYYDTSSEVSTITDHSLLDMFQRQPTYNEILNSTFEENLENSTLTPINSTEILEGYSSSYGGDNINNLQPNQNHEENKLKIKQELHYKDNNISSETNDTLKEEDPFDLLTTTIEIEKIAKATTLAPDTTTSLKKTFDDYSKEALFEGQQEIYENYNDTNRNGSDIAELEKGIVDIFLENLTLDIGEIQNSTTYNNEEIKNYTQYASRRSFDVSHEKSEEDVELAKVKLGNQSRRNNYIRNRKFIPNESSKNTDRKTAKRRRRPNRRKGKNSHVEDSLSLDYVDDNYEPLTYHRPYDDDSEEVIEDQRLLVEDNFKENETFDVPYDLQKNRLSESNNESTTTAAEEIAVTTTEESIDFLTEINKVVDFGKPLTTEAPLKYIEYQTEELLTAQLTTQTVEITTTSTAETTTTINFTPKDELTTNANTESTLEALKTSLLTTVLAVDESTTESTQIPTTLVPTTEAPEKIALTEPALQIDVSLVPSTTTTVASTSTTTTARTRGARRRQGGHQRKDQSVHRFSAKKEQPEEELQSKQVLNTNNNPFISEKSNATHLLSRTNADHRFNPLQLPKAVEQEPLTEFRTEVPLTDAPLLKSANPTKSKYTKVVLTTTPLSKHIRVELRKDVYSGRYSFNCFHKKLHRFYSDARDCRLFHYCTSGYNKNQMVDMKFVCDLGTYFDEEKLICTKEKPGRCL